MADRLEVHSCNAFAELPDDAVVLFRQQRDHDLFVSDYWFELFEADVVGSAAAVYFVVVYDGATIAVLPAMFVRRGRLGLSRLEGLANYYTTSFRMVFSPQCALAKRTVIRALAEYLRVHHPRLGHIELRPYVTETAELSDWSEAFDGEGFETEIFNAFGNYFEEVKGTSYADYLAKRPGRLRNLLKRRGRKLEQERQCEYQLVSDPLELSAAIADYELVYAKRGRLVEPYPEFIQGIVRAVAAEGRLRLGILKIDQQPAAAQVWFINGSEACLFKSAFDPQHASYSPGSLLTAFLVQGFLDCDQVSAIDFLSGDDGYKKDWTSSHRQQPGFEAISRRHPAGLARLAKRRVAALVSKFF